MDFKRKLVVVALFALGIIMLVWLIAGCGDSQRSTGELSVEEVVEEEVVEEAVPVDEETAPVEVIESLEPDEPEEEENTNGVR